MKENSVMHIQLPAYPPSKLLDFYSKLFGWKSAQLEGAPIEYHMMQTPNKEVSVGVVARMMPGQTQIMFVSTNSLDKKVEDAVKLGAQVLLNRQELPDRGVLAVLTDPEGNLFGLWEEKK